MIKDVKKQESHLQTELAIVAPIEKKRLSNKSISYSLLILKDWENLKKGHQISQNYEKLLNIGGLEEV